MANYTAVSKSVASLELARDLGQWLSETFSLTVKFLYSTTSNRHLVIGFSDGDLCTSTKRSMLAMANGFCAGWTAART